MSAIEEYLNALNLSHIKIETIQQPQPQLQPTQPIQFPGITITEEMIKASTVINWSKDARQLDYTDSIILQNSIPWGLRTKIKTGSNATIKIWPAIDKARERKVTKFGVIKPNVLQPIIPILLYHLVQTSNNPVSIHIDYLNKILSVGPHTCTYSTTRPICKHVLAAIWNDITITAIVDIGATSANRTTQIQPLLGDWAKLSVLATDDIREAALYFYIKNLMPNQWKLVNIEDIEAIYGHQATI